MNKKLCILLIIALLPSLLHAQEREEECVSFVPDSAALSTPLMPDLPPAAFSLYSLDSFHTFNTLNSPYLPFLGQCAEIGAEMTYKFNNGVTVGVGYTQYIDVSSDVRPWLPPSRKNSTHPVFTPVY